MYMCIKLCVLHEYLTLHLLLMQLHFINSTTAFGAGDTFEYFSSSSSCHPTLTEPSIMGSATVVCAHMFSWYCELNTHMTYGDTRSGYNYSTSWFGFCYLNMCHHTCITVTTGGLDCDVDTGTAHSQIAPPYAPTTGPPRA